MAFDTQGNLFIADADGNQVVESTLGGSLIVVAGTGVQGFGGDGGPATAAMLNGPQALAFGTDGTLFIADAGNRRIRAVKSGMISTIVGDGTGTTGVGAGLTAALQGSALATDPGDRLYIADSAAHRVWRFAAGVLSVFAGTGVQGFSGDGGPATAGELDTPSGLAVGSDGSVYIADTHNQRIRVVSPGGVLSTFAGSGRAGFSGNGGPALAAPFMSPHGLAIAGDGTVFVADEGNQRIRSISPSAVVGTVAGSGTEGTSADGATGTAAALHAPRALALSPFGRLAVADTLNGTVRELTTGQAFFQPAGLVSSRTSTVAITSAASQTLTVTVTGAAGTPQGAVQVSADGTLLGTVPLVAGAGSFTPGALAPGVHTFTAAYAGDGLNPAAIGSTAPGTGIPLIATANSVSAVYGTAVPALSGSLTGLLPQDAGQVTAVFATAAHLLSDVGTYPITATLAGPKSTAYTVTMAPASGVLRITQAASSVAVSPVAQAYAGAPLSLTASVAASTSGKPTGMVQFFDESGQVASAPVAGGAATGLYLAPSAGTHSVYARYTGDQNFAPSASLPVTAVVSVIPDFTLAAAGASTASVNAGGTATYTFSVASQSGAFTGAVSLSAAGLPTGATAVFSPVAVIPGTSSAVVTLTVQTSASQATLWMPGRRASPWAVAALGLGICSFRRRRRRYALLLGLTLLAGCGARTVTENLGGAKSYPLQVTGTATNMVGAVVTHSIPFTLSVQP